MGIEILDNLSKGAKDAIEGVLIDLTICSDITNLNNCSNVSKILMNYDKIIIQNNISKINDVLLKRVLLYSIM